MAKRNPLVEAERQVRGLVWLLPTARVQSPAEGHSNIPAALTIVDGIAQDVARGRAVPVKDDRADTVCRRVDTIRTRERLRRLGLVSLNRPDDVSPRTAPSLGVLNKRYMAEALGDAGTQAIDEALTDTGLALSDAWMCVWLGYQTINGRGAITARYVLWLTDFDGFDGDGCVTFDCLIACRQEDRLRGYRFEIVGQRLRSAEEAHQYPSDAIWYLQTIGDASLAGVGSLAIGVYRARVFHTDTSAFGEIRWRPGWCQVRYVTDRASPRDDALIRAGFELYQGIRKSGGRPQKSRETALDELANAGIRWLDAHLDCTIDDLYGAELAEATFRRDAKTLYEHLRRHHLTMADVKRRMLEWQGN